jgi:hypothetical protein
MALCVNEAKNVTDVRNGPVCRHRCLQTPRAVRVDCGQARRTRALPDARIGRDACQAEEGQGGKPGSSDCRGRLFRCCASVQSDCLTSTRCKIVQYFWKWNS